VICSSQKQQREGFSALHSANKKRKVSSVISSEDNAIAEILLPKNLVMIYFGQWFK
jgi:hypothetical protein